ncbi:Crp/Fnr family transcriptional regulator [Candidatus Bipolaricaulota bacterium]|nr:Crp/Fnr family transcriptional regulator [Candidatus Bipolaricaulota bacterium]
MEDVTNKTGTSLATWNRVIEIYAPLHVRYPLGELIYKAGSYAAGTYLVSSGFVSEYNMPQKGRPEKSLLEILGPGDLIGLEVFLGGRTELHLSCARAITETELFFFERAAFMKLIEEEETIKSYCLSCLSHRFYSLKQGAFSPSNTPLEERVGRLLLGLAEKSGEHGEEGTVFLSPEVTRATLSQLLGVSTAKVDRAIAALPQISQVGEQMALSPESLRCWLASATDVGKSSLKRLFDDG